MKNCSECKSLSEIGLRKHTEQTRGKKSTKEQKLEWILMQSLVMTAHSIFLAIISDADGWERIVSRVTMLRRRSQIDCKEMMRRIRSDDDEHLKFPRREIGELDR